MSLAAVLRNMVTLGEAGRIDALKKQREDAVLSLKSSFKRLQQIAGLYNGELARLQRRKDVACKCVKKASRHFSFVISMEDNFRENSAKRVQAQRPVVPPEEKYTPDVFNRFKKVVTGTNQTLSLANEAGLSDVSDMKGLAGRIKDSMRTKQDLVVTGISLLINTLSRAAEASEELRQYRRRYRGGVLEIRRMEKEIESKTADLIEQRMRMAELCSALDFCGHIFVIRYNTLKKTVLSNKRYYFFSLFLRNLKGRKQEKEAIFRVQSDGLAKIAGEYQKLCLTKI